MSLNIDASEMALYRAMLEYIYENQAIHRIHTVAIWIDFKNDNKYQQMTENYSETQLKLLFYNTILKNIEMFKSELSSHVAFLYFRNVYDENIAKLLENGNLVNSRPTINFINSTQFKNQQQKSSFLESQKQITQVDICFSFLVSTDEERTQGIFHSKKEIRKRMRQNFGKKMYKLTSSSDKERYYNIVRIKLARQFQRDNTLMSGRSTSMVSTLSSEHPSPLEYNSGGQSPSPSLSQYEQFSSESHGEQSTPNLTECRSSALKQSKRREFTLPIIKEILSENDEVVEVPNT